MGIRYILNGVSIPFKTGHYSHIGIRQLLKLVCISLRVSIPFKTGHYSHFQKINQQIVFYAFVSIPFKTGHYSHKDRLGIWISVQAPESQSLLKQVIILTLDICVEWKWQGYFVSIPFKTGHYSHIGQCNCRTIGRVFGSQSLLKQVIILTKKEWDEIVDISFPNMSQSLLKQVIILTKN